MISYLIKKILYGLLVLWGVMTLVFIVFYLKPGTPADMMGGQHTSPELAKIINRELGLDLPFHKQYFLYVNDVSPISILSNDSTSRIFADEEKYHFLNLFPIARNKALVLKKPFLRRSYQTKREVGNIISDALPSTALLAIISIFFALIIGVILGIISALRKGSLIDGSLLFISTLGMSGPSFFTAIIMAWLGGFVFSKAINVPVIPVVFFFISTLILLLNHKKNKGEFTFKQLTDFFIKSIAFSIIIWVLILILNGLTSIQWFGEKTFQFSGTGLNMTGSLYDIHPFEGEHLSIKNLILPVLTLAIRPVAVIVQLTRNSMLEVLKNDYIRTAAAKGLEKKTIVAKHALKNALNPVVTAVSGWFASLLAGAVFIEYIFGWKGIGWEVFDALQKDDFPVVMGVVLVVASLFVLINLLVDLSYGLLDPRVRRS